MLMVMNVTAGEDCVMAPASVPQPNAAKRLSARRLASTRRRGPTTVLEVLGEEPHPEEQQPNAAEDAAEHCNHPSLPGHRSRTGTMAPEVRLAGNRCRLALSGRPG